MDGVMQALVKKKTQWKEDLFFAMKFTPQKLSKYYTEVTPMMGVLSVWLHILDPVWNLRLWRKWDNVKDCNPDNETSYIT